MGPNCEAPGQLRQAGENSHRHRCHPAASGAGPGAYGTVGVLRRPRNCGRRGEPVRARSDGHLRRKYRKGPKLCRHIGGSGPCKNPSHRCGHSWPETGAGNGVPASGRWNEEFPEGTGHEPGPVPRRAAAGTGSGGGVPRSRRTEIPLLRRCWPEECWDFRRRR